MGYADAIQKQIIELETDLAIALSALRLAASRARHAKHRPLQRRACSDVAKWAAEIARLSDGLTLLHQL